MAESEMMGVVGLITHQNQSRGAVLCMLNERRAELVQDRRDRNGTVFADDQGAQGQHVGHDAGRSAVNEPSVRPAGRLLRARWLIANLSTDLSSLMRGDAVL